MWNLFRVNYKDTRRRHWRSSGVFIVNSEHMPHIDLILPLLNLNKPAGILLPTEPGNYFRYFELARIWKRDWKKRMKIYIKCCWQLTLEITLEDTLYRKRVYVQPFLRHLGHVTWKRSRSNIFPHCFKKWYKPTNNFFKRQGYFKRQSHKMVKHTQTICRQKRANCLSVFDLFVGWHLKG